MLRDINPDVSQQPRFIDNVFPEDALVSNPQAAAETALDSEHDAQADGDARADAKGILIIIVTAIAFAMHFVSGWTPDL